MAKKVDRELNFQHLQATVALSVYWAADRSLFVCEVSRLKHVCREVGIC